MKGIVIDFQWEGHGFAAPVFRTLAQALKYAGQVQRCYGRYTAIAIYAMDTDCYAMI